MTSSIFPPIALLLLLIPASNFSNVSVASMPVNENINFEKSVLLKRDIINDDIDSFTLIAMDFAKQGKVEHSLQLFEQAIKIAKTIEDQQNKVKIIATIAVNLAEVGQSQRSKQLFEQVVKLSNKPGEYFNKDEALSDISVKIAKTGNINYAVKISEKIVAKYIQAETLNSIVDILIKKGDIEQAKKILTQALSAVESLREENAYEYSYESNGSCANYKFAALAKIAANLSLLAQLDKAINIAKSISGCSSANGDAQEEYQSWAFLGIVANLRNLEQLKQTLTVAKTSSVGLEKLHILSGITLKLLDMGELNLALETSRIIAEDPQFDFGDRFADIRQKELYNIVTKLVEIGKIDAALQVAKTINTKSENSESLQKIATYLAQKGKFETALNIQKTIVDSGIKSLTLIEIAGELIKVGKLAEAEQLLSEDLISKIDMSEEYTAYQSIEKIAVALVKIDKVEQALQIIKAIKKPSYKANALESIINQLSDTGKLEKSLQLVKTIDTEESYEKAKALISIVHQIKNSQQIEEILKITRTIKAQDWQDTVFGEIAIKLTQLGEFERGISLAKMVKETYTNERNQTFANIVLELLKFDNINKALETTKLITAKDIQAETMANIATKLSK